MREGVLHSINVSDGGVLKLPRASCVVRAGGLEGDRQRDLENHGGLERAVSLYSLELGEVELQLTRDAIPCQKISGSFHDGRVVRVSEKVRPGWSRFYARVLREGTVRVGDRVCVIQP